MGSDMSVTVNEERLKRLEQLSQEMLKERWVNLTLMRDYDRATGPAVVLALVKRIRELEAELKQSEGK